MMKVKERKPTHWMRTVFVQIKMIEILWAKEKKMPRRFIVGPRIIVTTITEESYKMYMKSEKNWLDFQ